MFRPIRVDHTNCLQVAIKTHSFIHSDGHDLRILLSYITRRPGFVDTPPGIHHQTARSLHTHNHPLTDVADSMTSRHRHSGRKVLRQTATLWPCGSTCMRRVGRDHVCVWHSLKGEQRTCVCAWHSLKGERLIGVPSNLAAQNVMQLERVPHRGSFKLGRTQQIPDLNSRAHHTVASGLEIQKCHAARESA
jgi:hypothetical protein